MNSIQENIQISLLYLIKTDNAQDLQLDKIDFLNKPSYCNIIKEGQLVQIKGYFGSHKEIEIEIEQEINNKVNLFPYLNLSERGILITIAFKNQLLFCLILSETFFITKPINEKAIEIVLFRILQDLTDNIKFCLSDTILNQNWYKGELIPFSTQMLQRNDYNFNDEQNRGVLQYGCQWKLSKDILNRNILKSQTQSPKLFALQYIHFRENEEKEFYLSYDIFAHKLLEQIQTTQNYSIAQLIKCFQIEYQSNNLYGILQELSNKLEKQMNENIQNIFKKQKLNYALTFIQQFAQNKPLHVGGDLKQTIETYKKKMKSIAEDLKKQEYYKVQKVSLIVKRPNDNQSELVDCIMQNDIQTIILNSGFFQLQAKDEFFIIDIFNTKEKFMIYIIRINNSQTQIFLQMHKAKQPNRLISFDYKDSCRSVYFYDYYRGQLYIFNFKNKFVHQILISETGKLKSSQCICIQQENNNFFIIEQVAYLSDCDKFIVLSKDGVFKQQEQNQGFEKVKCIQQIKNEISQTEFTPSIRPDCSYNQIHTCPSGKYFYLANDYCCDRYDSNCQKIESVEIEGSIKIFADQSDVIILGKLKHEDQNEKQAKIISNLVIQKKFHKSQNNEQKIIGNPALDIVKGSFIKFGPNSQFLFKEKKRAINLYVNQEYCDKLDTYLDKMSIDGVNLNSSKFQGAELICDKIKNIIYSRVPLQLCTIENSKLIPLIDGFRYETQTQTKTSVDQKVKQLHLGFLEEHLSDCNKKIFVVGIIGKQSSGKSYLLNRVFGTRFSVSSARCTDGIWGSVAYIEDQIFLILDCEGLFNGARTDKEEIKMLAFLTAICDITILNSDLTLSRHLDDLFKNLVEASKQLNDQDLFKGILYFVLRDVSSNDNSGAEQVLLKNLDRLRQTGSEEIVFLKRLFQNQFSVEKLFNYETKQFDEQLIAVRKYFLDSSVKSNCWNGIKLIQMMKILLCQLEISDNTNASLIELQIRIEKIFDQSKEQWYQFTSDEVKCENLKLDQNKYQFQKCSEIQHILYNKDLLNLLYEDLEIKDSIQTHNKNLGEVQSQLNTLFEFRKEQIMLRTQQEISSIDNQEVQIMIKNNISMLQSFFMDQMKMYEFCFEKCKYCHLHCKHFKNHIEISTKLNDYIANEIKNIENQQKNLKIKIQDQEKEKLENIQKIAQSISEAQNLLYGLTIQSEINEIKQKKECTKTELMNYDFYNKEEDCINLSQFEIHNYKFEQPTTITLDEIQTIKVEITQRITKLKIIQTQTIESFKKKYSDLEYQVKDYSIKLKELSEIEINIQQSKLDSEVSEIQRRQEEFDNKLINIKQKQHINEQNLKVVREQQQQLNQDKQNVSNKNIEIDQQINKLTSQLEQINSFCKHLNQYHILCESLKEKSTQMQNWKDLQQQKLLETQEEKEIQQVLNKIEQLEKKVNDLKQNKEQLLIEVKSFQQYEIALKLINFKDIQRKLLDSNLFVHYCQRESHKCDQVCQVCPDQICDNKAGHYENQEHLCMKQDHRCKDTCEIPLCSNTCMKSFKHNSKHNCLSDHPCKEKCQYCAKDCKQDNSEGHYTNHNYLDIYCTHNCQLCPRKCCQPHDHSFLKENHLCGNIHFCQELCQEEGICKIEYDIQQVIWKNQSSEFPYTKYVAKDSGKKKCQQLIPANQKWHAGNHLCKDKTEKQFHYCNQQCPECNTYCDLQYNHSGPHSSDRHRNKENQIFTIQEGIQVNVLIQDLKDSTIRKYNLGESSAPETCDQSCKRRGRAHFHLVKCEGPKKIAKHSYEKYVGFEHIKFDEVLCEEFWKLNNWFHPIYNELETIQGCNYYCPICEYEKGPKSFCNQAAWHTQKDDIKSHSFSCMERHVENQIQGINVAFVIDSTGSMQHLIKMCINTIKDIMEQANAKKTVYRDKLEIKFAAVSYKDHKFPYNKDQNIIEVQRFTSDEVILQFLDKLQVDGGGDAPEAVLDGLNASSGLKWDQNYEKLLFLIADAPPHGKAYNNFKDNYPEGCPCGLKQDIILNALSDMKVQLKIVKLNQSVDLMNSEFKKDFSDLTIFSHDKKDEDNSFSIIVDDVCKYLTHTEITSYVCKYLTHTEITYQMEK
ncbi:unnamed protein product (macronuclear) [Paramecium tetraurelia]|uniref:VWFA domain-containing protein n=1 Tax=Paramecium tetraurelia TaxID=5888 RepID=A0EA74_PARTE|nr:uncharacterized protein GSPATT00024923001 [Paramecium tetraurelia]CAK92191.1 unnamed protein product [Paramecium tetraurelia]|eukprot:XP_001459588.1 hypothetical protein (macronuclear) [Paramecium tetraurelia strain d4-2]